MSGGVAWVWDPNATFEDNVNREMVVLSRMSSETGHDAYPTDRDDLRELLEAHVRFTGSTVATGLLDRWPQAMNEFVRVFPKDFMQALAKTDRGASGIQTFRSLLPSEGEVPPPKPPQPEPKKAKFAIQRPVLDIEDAGIFMKGRRPQITDPSTMAKNGFVRYDRAEIKKRTAKDRSADFLEVYEHKDEDVVRTQAARCMDCGTPFCHQSVTVRSGCPLGNLIPEWNALVKRGEWKLAYERLRQTNNFPEFTGRVCPAPCEASCTLGIIDDPVSIKSVELMIIDKAYEMGWMEPSPPPMRTGKTVAIIGSGPAGLAAADQLNHRGHSVTVFERSDRPGGLMMYGVPNMKADKIDVMARRIAIMGQEGVIFVCGAAGHIGQEGAPSPQDLLDQFDVVLLATGATVGRDLSNIPGR